MRVERAICKGEIAQIKMRMWNKNSFGKEGNSYFPGYEAEDDKFVSSYMEKLYNKKILNLIIELYLMELSLITNIPVIKQASPNKLLQIKTMIEYKSTS